MDEGFLVVRYLYEQRPLEVLYDPTDAFASSQIRHGPSRIQPMTRLCEPSNNSRPDAGSQLFSWCASVLIAAASKFPLPTCCMRRCATWHAGRNWPRRVARPARTAMRWPTGLSYVVSYVFR